MIKGKPPRLDLIYVDQPLYFVTFCTLHRQPSLANEQTHAAFCDYCLRAGEYGVGVGRYVIMPDHLHIFVRIWVRGLKRALSSGRNFWQPGFFDHILRTDESYGEKWNYVRDNPVRAGLVSGNDEWPFQGELVAIDRP
jgi:REP element-mobilizing transposase RayT